MWELKCGGAFRDWEGAPTVAPDIALGQGEDKRMLHLTADPGTESHLSTPTHNGAWELCPQHIACQNSALGQVRRYTASNLFCETGKQKTLPSFFFF